MESEPEEEGVWDPASDLPPAMVPKRRGRMVEAAIIVFGLLALISPLALWIAWTKTILVTVLGIGLFSIVACWVLAGRR